MSSSVSSGSKWCNDCQEERPRSEFHKCSRRPSGLQIYCSYHNGLRHRASKYGLTLSELLDLLDDQHCHICGKEEDVKDGRGLSIDHCGETRRVRGLLCGDCNNGLGRFLHDPVLLRKAAEYMECQ